MQQRKDTNVLAIVKGKERYVFLFDDNSRAKLLEVLSRYAVDPELSLSWKDVAVLWNRAKGVKRDGWSM